MSSSSLVARPIIRRIVAGSRDERRRLARHERVLGAEGRAAREQAAAVAADGARLYGSRGGQGQAWDVRRRCCVHAFLDRGGTRVSALAASADGALLAVGADSGAVNLYATDALLASESPPSRKEFLNLRTAITHVCFNPACEALVFASKYAKGAMRVAHVPSGRVFANWPTSKTPLGYVQTAAFSPSNGLLGISNDKGKVLLYRLNHYPAA